jgi:hypothetical protein
MIHMSNTSENINALVGSTGISHHAEEPRGVRIRGIRLFFLVMMLAGQLAVSPAQTPARMQTAYSRELVRVFEYRDSLEGVHPFTRYLYPIAIAQEGTFYVFDLDATGKHYYLAATQKTGMEVPHGVRAAFPLQFYDNRCACVVSADVFDSPKGYITIFHEFIHCHQYHTVEQSLRQQLPLAVKSQQKQDYMWEINYSFPYQDNWFTSTYGAFMEAASRKDLAEVKRLRKELAEVLNEDDYQYMVWQEWKEGFALYIENKLRNHLGIEQNQVGRNNPGSRLVFYAGGAAFIDVLVQQNPGLSEDLEGLFFSLYSI